MTPGRPDPALVRRHLAALGDAVNVLRSLRGDGSADLSADRERLWAVERGLQVCAQGVLDVATHLAAGAGHDVPDYATAIDRLREMGVVPAEFAARLRPLAGFRNVLVHAYLDVDVETVLRLLVERLDDFPEFSRHVESWLARAAGPDA
jgi:uncharacterized protein YutE (UPF0331/DUF86 family)